MSVLGRSSPLQDVWFSDEGDPDEEEIHRDERMRHLYQILIF